MDTELTTERTALLARQLFDEVDQRDAEAVLEEVMVIAIVAIPEDDGVNEECVFMSSTASNYANEGILHAALREHDRRMRAEQEPPE